MTHWYRDPKRFRLIEHLIRADYTFVLDPADFSDTELLRLREAFMSVLPAEKLVRDTCSTERTSRVLIVAPSDTPGRSIVAEDDSQQWAGVVLVPDGIHKETSLIELFRKNPYFENGARGQRVLIRNAIRPFVLDTRLNPHILSLQEQHCYRAVGIATNPITKPPRERSGVVPATESAIPPRQRKQG